MEQTKNLLNIFQKLLPNGEHYNNANCAYCIKQQIIWNTVNDWQKVTSWRNKSTDD